MGKHSKLFNSQNDYDSFILSDEFVRPNVSYIKGDSIVKFKPLINYNSQYLTFETNEPETKYVVQQSFTNDDLKEFRYYFGEVEVYDNF